MYLPRLRRIHDALKEIKNFDNNTCLTYNMIKQLMIQGKLTMFKYGNAYVVNLDELYQYFTKSNAKRGRPKKEEKL